MGAKVMLVYSEAEKIIFTSHPDPIVLETQDEMVAYSVYSVEGGQAAAEQLLNRGVTAFVCGSDDRLDEPVVEGAGTAGFLDDQLDVVGAVPHPVGDPVVDLVRVGHQGFGREVHHLRELAGADRGHRGRADSTVCPTSGWC